MKIFDTCISPSVYLRSKCLFVSGLEICHAPGKEVVKKCGKSERGHPLS